MINLWPRPRGWVIVIENKMKKKVWSLINSILNNKIKKIKSVKKKSISIQVKILC